MKSLTTIKEMLQGKVIKVPNYQRSYSWETPSKKSTRKTHTDVFLFDLEHYQKNSPSSPYYFGHFLFEENKTDDEYFYVIDGQQRLTTIIIFLSALFVKLESLRELSDDEKEIYEQIIRLRKKVRFSTVDWDDQFFHDYVIMHQEKDRNSIETVSSKRIADAYDYFVKTLAGKEEKYLTSMLKIVIKATCTTHVINDQAEAILMFLFQNDRGKKPSNLEVIKAQFMHKIHLAQHEDRQEVLREVSNRFEKIYKSISEIDYNINEDDVLTYTARIYFNTLKETNTLVELNKKIQDEDAICFIQKFSHELARAFENLKKFLVTDERNNFSIHSLVSLGGLAIAFPFIIKAYKFGLDHQAVSQLCETLENLILRHRLVRTRADLSQRLDDIFKEFTETNSSLQPLIERLTMMSKTTDYGWAYWNDTNLKNAMQGPLDRQVARHLLWKYENLLESKGQKLGYNLKRYDAIVDPHLEHIAPLTEPKPSGSSNYYDKYDEEFQKRYLDCIGNYLLISGRHNQAIGNISFRKKYESYTLLEQQKEVRKLADGNKGRWDRKVIDTRKDKILDAILKNIIGLDPSHKDNIS